MMACQQKFIFSTFTKPHSLLIVVVFFVLSLNASSQTEKAKLQSRKARLETELNETNNELNETRKDKTANLKQLVLINKKINKREDLINAIEQEVGGIDGQIGSLNDTIWRIERNLQAMKQEYAKLIYSTYRNKGASNKLMFMFASRDFNQAVKRMKYMQQYTEYRQRQADEILHTQQILVSKKLELETSKSSKLSLKRIQERERSNLAFEKQEKDQKVKSLTSQEKKLLVKLREKETALNQLQNAIESLVAAEIRKANEEKARKASEAALAARAKAKPETPAKTTVKKETKPTPSEAVARPEIAEAKAAVSTKSTSSMSVSAEEVALTGSFSGNKGRLPAPVDRGTIISSFGEHPHPDFQNIRIRNNGIDISTTPGAKAKVIFDGEVSSVMFIANLNYVVIVRHGDYLSVYSNLQSADVRKGDKVRSRQSLGAVAVAEGDSQAKLHFELWLGTTVLNPATWLRI